MHPTPLRRHDIDALRVLVLGLLILYHVGMLYVAEWEWHLKSSYQSEALQYFMLASNRWRMPILFLVSGVALSLLARRTGAATLLRQRSLRLLLPLVFGVVVVVPIQPYCQGVANGAVAPGFSDFIVRYWSFAPWPRDAFDGWEYGFTWNHLWYLPYLWCYTTLLLLALPLLRSRAGRAVRDRVVGLRGAALLLVPAAPKLIALCLLGDRFPASNDLIHDWYQHALFFSMFLLGWWLSAEPGVWAELKALRWTSLRLALLATAAFAAAVLHLLEEDVAGSPLLAVRVLSSLTTWLCIAAVLGWSYALLDRPWPWLAYASEAVFPWYVLHQSLIVAIAYVVVPLQVGPLLEPVLVVGGTLLGCAVLHEGLIRRSAWLRPLFGLKPAPSLARVAATATDRSTAAPAAQKPGVPWCNAAPAAAPELPTRRA